MVDIKNIRLRGNKLLITFEKEHYDVKKNGIIVAAKGSLSEFQTIMEIGPDVNLGIESEEYKVHVGDKIMVNFDRYFEMRDARGFDNAAQQAMSSHSKEKIPVYVGDTITVNNIKYALINSDDIVAIIDGEEVIPDESNVILPETNIITHLS